MKQSGENGIPVASKENTLEDIKNRGIVWLEETLKSIPFHPCHGKGHLPLSQASDTSRNGQTRSGAVDHKEHHHSGSEGQRSRSQVTHCWLSPCQHSTSPSPAGTVKQGGVTGAPSSPRRTCGEVDVGEEDDVGGDERDELGDADLLLEVHVHHVLLPQAAVGAGVQQLQAGAEAAQEPGQQQHSVTHLSPGGLTATSKARLSPGLAPKLLLAGPNHPDLDSYKGLLGRLTKTLFKAQAPQSGPVSRTCHGFKHSQNVPRITEFCEKWLMEGATRRPLGLWKSKFQLLG